MNSEGVEARIAAIPDGENLIVVIKTNGQGQVVVTIPMEHEEHPDLPDLQTICLNLHKILDRLFETETLRQMADGLGLDTSKLNEIIIPIRDQR